jgi:8-oxo-dGTP diphosphatase
MEIWDILDRQGNLTGKTIVRGEELKEEEYHLVVHIWIMNSKGEFLIQKRAEVVKIMPGMWAATGGSVLAGEDSKAAALREVKEELGIDINGENLIKIERVLRKHNFGDVWFIKENVNLENLELLEEEVSDAKWMTKDEIKIMIDKGEFHDYGVDYFKNLYEHADKA